METDNDLEAQRVASQSLEVERQYEMQGIATRPSHAPNSDTSSALPVSNAQDTNPKGQSVSQAEGRKRNEDHETNAHQFQINDAIEYMPIQAGKVQAEAEVHSLKPTVDDPPIDPGGPHNGGTDDKVGNSDSGGDALWLVYEKEAKDRDEQQFNIVKDDMDGVFLLGGLFAAALAPLIIDSKQNLKADPTDRIVYYLEQHSTILNQISQQISFIAPEVSIPSTPPLPFPPFAPSSSNIALNTLWFFALVYGIFGALAATLVQKWIRRCLRTLQRSNNPMTSARFRQYLFEQLNKSWITELASNLLYASLFCFFVGLCIYAWDLNSAVASITTIYSITCVCFYFFFQSAVSSEIPIVEPFILFLYFSGVFTQKKMEELWNSKGQDVRAIRWLIENLEEDAEMETFVLAIPGSFNTGWGAEVWKKVSEVTRDESDNKSSATTNARLQGVEVPKLYARVYHLLDTCKDPFHFAKPEERRRRMRGCIEAIALLVCRANAELDRFGDFVKFLGDTGTAEKTRDSSSVETDGPFVMRWTCLSLLIIRSTLDRSASLREKARLAVETLAGEDDTGDDRALASAQNIDGTLRNAWSSLLQLNNALIQPRVDGEQVTSILRHYEPQVSQLENILIDVDRLSRVDQQVLDVQSFIVTTSQGIIHQLPGVQFDDFDSETGPVPVQPSDLVERSDQYVRLGQFIFPGQALKSICSLGPTFRTALDGMWNADAHRELLENVKGFLQVPTWKENLLQRQLWRLQDLRDGGGLGFTVELYFLTLKQLLSIPPSSSNESHSPLYIGAFRAISSDWAKYKYSLGTQKLLLDMILPSHGIISEFRYPTDVTDEFLELLGNILEGQGGSHLGDAMQVLSAPDIYYASYGDEQDAFRANVLRVITKALAPVLDVPTAAT